MFVDEGDFVEAGQPLVRMQTDVLEAQRDEAEAMLQEARQAVATAQSTPTRMSERTTLLTARALMPRIIPDFALAIMRGTPHDRPRRPSNLGSAAAMNDSSDKVFLLWRVADHRAGPREREALLTRAPREE